MKPGDKLVCVNNEFGTEDKDVPKLNEVVTFLGMCFEFDDAYLIAEYNPQKYCYDAYHFRPLDEVLSEISIEELTHQLV